MIKVFDNLFSYYSILISILISILLFIRYYMYIIYIYARFLRIGLFTICRSLLEALS